MEMQQAHRGVVVDGAPVVLYLHARTRRDGGTAARVPVAEVAASSYHRGLQRGKQRDTFCTGIGLGYVHLVCCGGPSS
jgi:hypothetical protein